MKCWNSRCPRGGQPWHELLINEKSLKWKTQHRKTVDPWRVGDVCFWVSYAYFLTFFLCLDVKWEKIAVFCLWSESWKLFLMCLQVFLAWLCMNGFIFSPSRNIANGNLPKWDELVAKLTHLFAHAVNISLVFGRLSWVELLEGTSDLNNLSLLVWETFLNLNTLVRLDRAMGLRIAILVVWCRLCWSWVVELFLCSYSLFCCCLFLSQF